VKVESCPGRVPNAECRGRERDNGHSKKKGKSIGLIGSLLSLSVSPSCTATTARGSESLSESADNRERTHARRSEAAKNMKKMASSSTANGNKKPAVDPRREPPFCLYQDPTKLDFTQGLDSVIHLLRGRKNIIVLLGAGISVSCGIPDFRSKGSGLYSTLDAQDLGLSCPEDLFDWEFFQEDPRPFFKFASSLYFPLGGKERVRPSDSHKLLALLEQNKMLLRVYSQNIDGLEEVAGVSPKKIVYAHGSLQWATCCKCKQKVASKDIEGDILKGVVARCQAPVITTPTSVATRELSQRSSRKRPNPMLFTSSLSLVSSEDNTLVCGGVLKPGVTL